MALGKEMLHNFFKKNLCRGQWESPRQRTLLCRGPWSLPSAKRQKFQFFFCFLHSIDTSISYIYIYISHRTHFLTIYQNHNCEPQITIYYNDNPTYSSIKYKRTKLRGEIGKTKWVRNHYPELRFNWHHRHLSKQKQIRIPCTNLRVINL